MRTTATPLMSSGLMQTAVNMPDKETPEKTERNEQIEQLKLINKNLSMINKELHNINKNLSRM